MGILPSVDVNKSVSRVGGKAQLSTYRAVAGSLKLAYAQFEELEALARFGRRLDENTRKIIEYGRGRIRACLKQAIHDMSRCRCWNRLLYSWHCRNNLLDRVSIGNMKDVEYSLREAAQQIPDDIRQSVLSGDMLSERCGLRNNYKHCRENYPSVYFSTSCRTEQR